MESGFQARLPAQHLYPVIKRQGIKRGEKIMMMSGGVRLIEGALAKELIHPTPYGPQPLPRSLKVNHEGLSHV